MPNTEQLNQVLIQVLRQDELDYPGAAAKFGTAVLPLLKDLIKSDDENLATKAAYLAGYISGDEAKDVIVAAASNKFTTVRLAAAFGAQKLKAADAEVVLAKALEDNDPGVQKVAMNSVASLNVAKKFKSQLSKIASTGQDEILRNLAGDIAKKAK